MGGEPYWGHNAAQLQKISFISALLLYSLELVHFGLLVLLLSLLRSLNSFSFSFFAFYKFKNKIFFKAKRNKKTFLKGFLYLKNKFKNNSSRVWGFFLHFYFSFQF